MAPVAATPLPPAEPAAYRVMRRLTITLGGQVMTYHPGQVLFEGDRALGMLLVSEPNALKPVKDTVVCPRCGCAHSAQ